MKKVKIIKNVFWMVLFVLSLTACSTFFDKDNTPAPSPLVDFITEAHVHSLWYTSTSAGSTGESLRLTPAISGNSIFTASSNGVVAANDLATGKSLWKINTGGDISGGVSAADGQVYVGTRDGDLFALDQTNGKILWKTHSSSEILAAPAATDSIVLAKSIDGCITAFSTIDGHLLWKSQQTEPSLILRGSSAPQLTRSSAVVGFENGDLLKFGLRHGDIQWQKSIAEPQGIFAVQRMIDMDANPVIHGNRVYAATYQGRIAALDLSSGNEIWSHDMSSYTGMATDGSKVYVSDAESHISTFNAANGTLLWQQNKLYARVITGPALIHGYLVVGDAEGYLHWMNTQNGRFVARVRVNKSGMAASPIVNNDILYVYTKDGHLAAYTVQ
ncbi:MAG TPA: outer membrane protein assembly factor BamB [Gammaproteobacteria bacterium]|nr:outer membrane protein assembly factor BamB [Gammaproteobacteria bacterium]